MILENIRNAISIRLFNVITYIFFFINAAMFLFSDRDSVATFAFQHVILTDNKLTSIYLIIRILFAKIIIICELLFQKIV